MAAPQIGYNLRIFVTEIRVTKLRKTKELDGLRIFINPEITYTSKNMASGYEGCGSVAHSGLFGKVTRPTQVTVCALDENNKEIEYKAKGLIARVIQHEIDHLNGTIFLDKVTDMKSLMSEEEYKKIKI
jgi:peptide deformylase